MLTRVKNGPSEAEVTGRERKVRILEVARSNTESVEAKESKNHT